MKVLGFNALVVLLLVGAAAVVGTACSSSSGDASPNGESVPEAGLDANTAFDSGTHEASSAPSGLTLTWNLTAPAVTDGGLPGVPDAGGGVTSADGGASGEAGVSDAATANDDFGASSATTVPVVGATVCVYQMPSIGCVTSDVTGLFALPGLPAMTNLPISITMPGFRPELVPIQTASTNMDETAHPIGLTRIQTGQADSGPVENWTSDAVVSFFAIAPLPGSQVNYGGDPGASVTIAPAIPDAGPYYLYDDGTYATGATAFVATAGIYENVPPGTYTITLNDPNHDCSDILTPFAPYGYPAGALSVQFPAVAGYITGPLGFFCTASTVVVDAGQ